MKTYEWLLRKYMKFTYSLAAVMDLSLDDADDHATLGFLSEESLQKHCTYILIYGE
jgi:hypothetical protein